MTAVFEFADGFRRQLELTDGSEIEARPVQHRGLEGRLELLHRLGPFYYNESRDFSRSLETHRQLLDAIPGDPASHSTDDDDADTADCDANSWSDQSCSVSCVSGFAGAPSARCRTTGWETEGSCEEQ